jgi:hypothetical protein
MHLSAISLSAVCTANLNPNVTVMKSASLIGPFIVFDLRAACKIGAFVKRSLNHR